MARGRPQDPEIQQQRKDKLIAAAHTLLKRKSFRSITIRELAAEAGVQSSMISYYFGDKEALFIAMLEQISAHHFSNLALLSEHPQPLKSFIRAMLEHFEHNHSIGRMLMDDVLEEPSALAERFIELFPKQMVDFLPALIEREQNNGLFRQDLNPRWAAFSLINMIIMPFFADPIREQTWRISRKEIASQAWADHIYQLFILGAKEQGLQ
jgi:AcrR family transcriptional regulator